MWKSIFLLVFQGISGGVAGYITNKYAVNMLFKEYTPLKLGGVIKKKKEKFIEEISELVERDIINAETLKAQTAKKNLNSYIEQIAESFLTQGLEKSLGNAKISDIADFENSVYKSEEFLRENLNEFLPKLLDDIFIIMKLEDILTEDQISKIAASGYDLLVEEFENSDVLKEFTTDFYKENSNITLSNIFSEEFQIKLIKNINQAVTQIIKKDILQDEKSLRVLFDKLLASVNIDSVLIKLQKLIQDYEINKFVTESEEEEFTIKLFNKVNEFINSEEGTELITEIMSEILHIGKDIDFTIYELLPAEMEESLTNFIETVIPKVMPYISEWISGNKEAFDNMIEEAIDEAIQDVDGNIKKLIITKVRSALMGDISSKNNIVNKIINYINESFDGESYSKIASGIIEYLRTKKIKDIVELLEKQNLFKPEKLSEFLIRKFNSYGKGILGSIIKSQFSKKIHSVFKFDLVELFNEKLKPAIYENIVKNKDKLGVKLIGLTEELITSKGNEIFNKKVSELFTENKVSNFSISLSKLLSKLSADNKSVFKVKIAEYLSEQVKNINLSDLVKKYKEDASTFIVDNSINAYKKTVDEYKNYEIKEVINTYVHKNLLSDILINKGYPELMGKLSSLLDGKIKQFSKDSLRKYNEDEICNIVQDFMGGQLKPLSVFGAVLGATVGVLYQLIFPDSIGSYGFPGSVLNTFMSCGIMAFIGYITNVVALWMIFHPYKENKIVAKIPFFKKFALGYIPAHKNEFAVGMAKLIDEELLNKEEINKAFQLKHNNIKSSLMMLVTNNNYQSLINLLRDKKKELSKWIYGGILKHCNNSSYLSTGISKIIGSGKCGQFINKDSVLNISPKLIGKLSGIQGNLIQFAERKLLESTKNNETLPQSVYVEIDKYVQNEINTLVREKAVIIKDSGFVNKIINNYSSYYDLKIKKSPEEIFAEEALTNIKNNIREKIEEYIFNDLKTSVSDFGKQFLQSGLNEGNTIGHMFNGKIKNIIDGNLALLTAYIITKATNYLQDNQDIIALNVKETIKSELNFFEMMAYGAFGGDAIAEKVVEIILNEKLPVMFKDEADKIIDVTKNTLNNSIYPIEVSTLKIKADEINIAIILDNGFEKFTNSDIIRHHVHNALNLILNSVMRTPLTEYLELCNLNSLGLVYKKLENEVNIVGEEIYNNINLNSNELSRVIGEFLNEKVVKPSINLHIFEQIEFADIEYSIKNIIGLISSSKETEKYLGIFLERFYDNKLSELKLEQIIDVDMLSNDFKKLSRSINGNEIFNENNIKLINEIVQNVIDNRLDFITEDTKNYLADKTIQAGLYSIDDYIVPVLQEINLKDITNKQIELLNPKEIDVLFNSFAGDFFRKLEIYGVFGFVFGINAVLSIILWALDYRYSNVSSKKDLTRLGDL